MEENKKEPIKVTYESRNVFVPEGDELEFEGVVLRCEEDEFFDGCKICDARHIDMSRPLCYRLRCSCREDEKVVHFVKVREL